VGDWLEGPALAGTLLSFGLLIFLRSRITAGRPGPARGRRSAIHVRTDVLVPPRLAPVVRGDACRDALRNHVLSLVYALPGVVVLASLSVFIGAARDADILTAEGKTMNGSAEKRQPSIVLHGVGVQAGASACWRRAGRRSRREAAVAAHWRMGPAAGGPTNSFFVRRETGTIRATHLETATRHPTPRPQRSCRAGAKRPSVLPERGPCVFDPSTPPTTQGVAPSA
jgi:hypothetical protein